MNKMIKIFVFVLVSANVFQAGVFAQGGRGNYRDFYDRMPSEQRQQLQDLRQRSNSGNYDEQGQAQQWRDYNQQWYPQ